jgi:hypothetical protein
MADDGSAVGSSNSRVLVMQVQLGPAAGAARIAWSAHQQLKRGMQVGGYVEEVPEQPEARDQVYLHGKQNRGHALDHDVAEELARELGRRLVAMDGMTVTVDPPFAYRAQQFLLSEMFLALTSTPNGWWQVVLNEGVPRSERMKRWAEMATAWLAERRRAR